MLSLTDNTSGIMAWANDEGYDRVFVEQLKNLASPGDCAVDDLRVGQQPEHPQVRWSGRDAHGMDDRRVHGVRRRQAEADLAHHNLHAAIDDMGMVESLHLLAFHWVIDDLHRRFAALDLKADAPIAR